MAYDGIRYGDAALIAPYAYAPHAPMTAEAYGRSLITSYFQSRHGARRVLQQVYQYNERQTATNGIGGTSTQINTATLIDHSDAYAYVDDDFTHARCAIIFAAYPRVDAVASHRMIITDGSTTVTGTTHTIDVPAADQTSVTTRWTTAGLTGGNLYFAQSSADIRTLTRPGRLQFRVQGRTTDSAIGAGYVYRPMYVCAWVEIVD